MLDQLTSDLAYDVYNTCRTINQYLGVVLVVCVIWRGLPLALTRAHSPWIVRHRVICFHVLALFGFGMAVGSIWQIQKTTSNASPGALIFTIAALATVFLCIFWPHPTHPVEGEEFS